MWRTTVFCVMAKVNIDQLFYCLLLCQDSMLQWAWILTLAFPSEEVSGIAGRGWTRSESQRPGATEVNQQHLGE